MNTATTRREQHRQALRRVILDAARELFVHEGFEGVTMRKLAAKIGYSAGNIYLHFKTKEELFGHLRDESFALLHQVLSDQVEASGGSDPVRMLVGGLHAYVDFGLTHPDDYRIVFLLQPPVVQRPYQAQSPFDILRSSVRRCVESGSFRQQDVEASSQALWAAVHGVTSLLLQRPEFPWVDKQTLIDRVIDSAVGALVAIPDTKPTQDLGERDE